MMRIFSLYGKFSLFFRKNDKILLLLSTEQRETFFTSPTTDSWETRSFSSSVVVRRSTTRKTFLRWLSPRHFVLNIVEHRHWRCWKILFFCHRACELEVGGMTRNHFHSVKLKSVKIIFYFLIMMSIKRERLLNWSTGWEGWNEVKSRRMRKQWESLLFSRVESGEGVEQRTIRRRRRWVGELMQGMN